MLSVILLILKIIGYILLAVLGLLLLVLLTVLLVPLRYRIAVEHGEKLSVEGRASWLLHVLHARITHMEGVLHIRVRLFGFIFYDNLRPRKPKKETPSKKYASKVTKETSKARLKPHEGATKKAKQEMLTEKPGKAQESRKLLYKDEGNNEEQHNEQIKEQHKEQITDQNIDRNKYQSKDQNIDYNIDQNIDQNIDRNIDQSIDRNIDRNIDQIKEQHKAKKETLFDRIIKKFREWKERLITSFRELKNKIIHWFETIVGIKHKIRVIYDFIQDKMNREGFHVTYQSLKKLLKHILPTKLKSSIIFGTGDPCSTGQVLGVLGILYSFYGDKVIITPDFENKRLEGRHHARGRIRLITILIIVIKLMLDKRFKQVKTNFQLLKEAL